MKSGLRFVGLCALSLLCSSIAYSGNVDPLTLVWTTCGACPTASEVITSGATVTVGVNGRPQSEPQGASRHVAAALLPPAASYTIKFSVNLSTWDSYNAPGTVNPPPFDGGTGYWDSFSLSVTDKPYWQLSLTDPITTAQIPGGAFFIWGGASYGNQSTPQSLVKTSTITITGNPTGSNFLNVGLDTATPPFSDTNYPSWGTVTIHSIEATQPSTDIPRIAGITSYYQAGDPNVPGYPGNLWGVGLPDGRYDSINSTIREVGCAMTSLAMVLSKYGHSFDPGTLNAKLNAIGGYKLTDDNTRGDVKWQSVSSINKQLEAKTVATSDTILLDAELQAGRPVILRVTDPTIGAHFVVAVGKTSGIYDIIDPGHRFVTTLAERYGNTFKYMIRFVPAGSGAFVVNAPVGVDLLVTDPQGRRVGQLNGTEISEISESAYVEAEIANDEPARGGASIGPHRVLAIPSPTDGYYRIVATSATSGPKSIQVYRYNRNNLPESIQTFSLDMVGGQPVLLSLPYSARVGDINGDGIIDAKDLAIVKASFGKRSGQAGYDVAADVNADGIVNVRDLAYVGKSDPPPTNTQIAPR